MDESQNCENVQEEPQEKNAFSKNISKEKIQQTQEPSKEILLKMIRTLFIFDQKSHSWPLKDDTALTRILKIKIMNIDF